VSTAPESPVASLGEMVEAWRRVSPPDERLQLVAAGIFVERDGELVPMADVPYSSEDLFQALLARHVELLAGDQLTPDLDPRRFVLVRREAGVPDSPGAADRWSLDHLFLDQDGVPTLVEVKRSSDTRIRREVVGQMLDYAANAVVYWPAERLIDDMNRTYGPDGATTQLRALLELTDREPDETEAAINAFWQQVAANLAAGRLRLLFVADTIPTELRRIIEFLNQQMTPAEVLGIEIKNYEGTGLRALVPRIIGLTEAARDHKTTGPRQTMDEIWAAAPASTHAARSLLDAWAAELGLRQWDEGKSRRYSPPNAPRPPIYLQPTYDQVYFFLDTIPEKDATPLRTTLSDIVGKPVATKEPGIACSTLVNQWTDLEHRLLRPLIAAAGHLAE
jgi:hypothetical protein